MLTEKYFGPYELLERVGPIAYRVCLPAKDLIHDVFHVAFMKKFEGTPPAEPPPLPPIVRGQAVPTAEMVVRAKPTKDSWELHVHWQGIAAKEATWAHLDTFKEANPDFQLEEELFRRRGGSVMDAFYGKTYSRRKKKETSVVGLKVARTNLNI